MISSLMAYKGYGPECPMWAIAKQYPKIDSQYSTYDTKSLDVWRLEKYESFHQIEGK